MHTAQGLRWKGREILELTARLWRFKDRPGSFSSLHLISVFNSKSNMPNAGKAKDRIAGWGAGFTATKLKLSEHKYFLNTSFPTGV